MFSRFVCYKGVLIAHWLVWPVHHLSSIQDTQREKFRSGLGVGNPPPREGNGLGLPRALHIYPHDGMIYLENHWNFLFDNDCGRCPKSEGCMVEINMN